MVQRIPPVLSKFIQSLPLVVDRGLPGLPERWRPETRDGRLRFCDLGKLRSIPECAARSQNSTRPCLMAKWTSSALVCMPRVSIIWYLWNSTVRVEIERLEAISFAERPSARS